MLDSVEGRAFGDPDDPDAVSNGAQPSAQPGPAPLVPALHAARGAGRSRADKPGSPSVHDEVYAEAVGLLHQAAAKSRGTSHRGADPGSDCEAHAHGSEGPGRAGKRRRVLVREPVPRVDADEIDSLADDEEDSPSAEAEPSRSRSRANHRDARTASATEGTNGDGIAVATAHDDRSPAAAAGSAGVRTQKQGMGVRKAPCGRGRGSGRGRGGRGGNTRGSDAASAPLRRGRSRTS